MAKIFPNPALVAALSVASDFLEKRRGEKVVWSSVTEPVRHGRIQAAWLAEAARMGEDLKKYPELDALADYDPILLNEFFSKRKWQIRFPVHPPEPLSFYAGAAYRIKVPWLVEGETKQWGESIVINGKPAFRLDRFGARFRTLGHPDLEYPIIDLPSLNRGDHLLIAPAEETWEKFALWKRVKELNDFILAGRGVGISYDDLVLPNIELKTDPEEVDELRGMHWREWRVKKVLMQGELLMGPKGASVGGAGGMRLEALGISRKLEVNYDILIWFYREGCQAPGLAAYVPKEEFSDHQVDVEL